MKGDVTIKRMKNKSLERGDTIASERSGHEYMILKYYKDNSWNRIFNSKKIGCYKVKQL